jgi:hypothetical protein
VDTIFVALEDHAVYPPSGAVARRVGAKKYFTGSPCLVGHVTPRYAHNGQCMACGRLATAKERLNPRARAVARASYERRRTTSPERLLWYSAKSRARKLGLPFDITFEDIRLVWPESWTCPAVGIPLVHHHRGEGRSYVHDSSPTLDRIIPSKGYTKGNIKVISHLANKLKSDATDASFFRGIATYLDTVKETS